MTIRNTSSLVALFAAGAATCFLVLHLINRNDTGSNGTMNRDHIHIAGASMQPEGKPDPTDNPPIPFREENWTPGGPHPVEPEDPALPPSGKAPLRTLLGWKAEWHVHNSVCGFVPNPDTVSYVREQGRTRLVFSTGWEIEVEDSTGRILVPPGLPALSDERLADMTWRALVANEGLERWRDVYRRAADDGTMLEELVDVHLDEIRRVGDKAFISWRLVESPPPDEEGFIRLEFWVDVRTEKIVYEGTEINEDR